MRERERKRESERAYEKGEREKLFIGHVAFSYGRTKCNIVEASVLLASTHRLVCISASMYLTLRAEVGAATEVGILTHTHTPDYKIHKQKKRGKQRKHSACNASTHTCLTPAH